MRYLTVFHSDRLSLLSDERVVPADDVAPFHSALALSAALSDRLAGEDERMNAAERLAREAAQRAGYEDGRASAAREAAAKLLVMHERTLAQQARYRDAAVNNALAIVRHIASSLGDTATLAALALDAAEALMPCDVIAVRVHPAQYRDVQFRLASMLTAHPEADHLRAVLRVDEDATLESGQCRLQSAAGTVLAGLETQLRNIEQQARPSSASAED